MKTITPKNKQTITKRGIGNGAGSLPAVGPGKASTRKSGMNPSVATGDKSSAKAY